MVVICHTGGSDSDAPHQQHRQADCGVCPMCQTLAPAAILLQPSPSYFHDQTGQTVAMALPPLVLGAPERPVASYPTGPPVLV